MNRTNNQKNYAQAAAQQKNNKQASHTNNPHQNQQHHHQQVSQQNQASGPSTSSNFSSSANGKPINNSQTKPQAQHNSTMGNGNTGRSTSIKQQKNSVTLPSNGHAWETAPTSLVFGSIKNTQNAQVSSLPSTNQTLTSGGGLPTTLPTKGVPTFGSLPTNTTTTTTTTPTTQATQATQATPTTVGTSGPGVNIINNNNNNNNSNGTSKTISVRANEIPRTHSAPPQFQDSNNRNNIGQSGHTSNVGPARSQLNNIHQQQSAAVSHQQSSVSVSNPPLNHRKDSVSSTVSSNDGQPPFHPHHSPHHPPPNHVNQHGHPHYRQHQQPHHHSNHKPNIQYSTRSRDNKSHPSPLLNPAQQPVPTQQNAMHIPPMFPPMYNRYYMDSYGYPVVHHNAAMYIPPPFVPQRPPISQPLPPVNNVPSFQKQTANKAIEIIDPTKNAPIQFNINNPRQQQQKNLNVSYKKEETPSAVPDKKPDKERPNSDDKNVSKAVPIINPEDAERERKEQEEREQERIMKEKAEQERKEREERERLEAERLAKEKEEQERKERERLEAERLAKEKEEQERKEREERERKEREEKEERERKERERLEAERIAKEKEEQERKEREERERKEREEKEEQERKERERLEAERLAKEKEEQERKEREERERKEREEKEEQERKERERLEAERIAKEKEEKERKEREERERKEREEKEERERIEKERKEAEEKALKEEAERKKKEEEEAKAKAIAEEEAEKTKKAEKEDKKEDKKEEKKRPDPLDLTRTTSAPAIPSAPLSALGSARMLDDLSSIQYPQGIKSPAPELNSNAEPGKFKYDRTFLMQFMTVCKEKPENLPALEAIGMDEPKDDKKRTSARTSSGSRTSSLHKGSPNQSQFTQMGEFKFLKTSEERFAAATNMRNGTFGRTGLSRTGSGSILLPPMSSTANPPSPGRPPSGRRDNNRRNGKGSHQMQGPNVGQEHVAPLERSENRWVPQILGSKSNDDTFEALQRKVKALLNKLTLEKFDSISDQIIDHANRSRDERDGRILREVIRLIFEKSCDESNFCAMYAQLCRKMMERVDPEIVDENVKNTEGKFVQGGTLFRKYLLNRCQEEFEKGWKVNIPLPSNEKGEPDLMSDEYYAAAKAKRQGLGLIRFIGELFKLNMLTERIMHECIKKLLIFQGTPEEEEMESLCKLMNTVGEQLDHVKPPNPHEQVKSTQIDHAKAKKYMESYFERMEEISKLPNLSSRIKFMLMDVIDLRSNAWKPRRDINAPKTIAEIHEDAAKQKEEAEYLRRSTSSGGRGMPKMAEQMSRSSSGRQHRSDKGMGTSSDGWSTVGGSSSQRNKEKVGDLTKFGTATSRSKIINLAPGGILGSLSGGAKGWPKSDNKLDRDDKSPNLSRPNSTNIYSVLTSESIEGRKSSESVSSDTSKPSPPSERKRLILAPRTKGITTEEPAKVASKSTSEAASSAQTTSEELDPKKINSLNNTAEEYFGILDNREVILCLEEIPAEYHPKAIEIFANKVIEKKQKDVDNVMKLFKEIVSSRTCDADAFKDGFKATLEFLMDIGADAPMAYSFTGQLLFSTGLDFRDITKLLKPLDDDSAIEKIVKGYANALKNDVDEQQYVQKINEFDLKSLFQKKNKDDINKFIEDLGGSSKNK